jgi:hypothetical protein
MTNEDCDFIANLTRVLWGATVWRVRLNLQYRFESGALPEELYSPDDLDELCLDFATPLVVPEKIRKTKRVGSLWINTAQCGLRVQERGKVLMNSGDSTARVRAVLPTMIGRPLVRAHVAGPGGDTQFVFENERVLTCFPASSQRGINWVISTGSGDEIKLGPGIRISYQTSLR